MKNLRNQRNNLLENGNIIDLFIRKCFIDFSKKEFQDLFNLSKKIKSYINNENIEYINAY